MKGKLIVIDGTDGSGKATQTKLLVEKLRKEGYDVELIEFPQFGQKSAALIEEYLNGSYGPAKEVGPYRASIFYACDRYAASFKIREWLKEEKIVICNRYMSSNIGHQAGKIKDKKKRDKFLEWLKDLEFDLFNIPKPNINILLYIPPRVGQDLVEQKLQTTISLFEHQDYKNKLSKQKDSRKYIVKGAKDIHESDIDHLKDAAAAYKYAAKKYSWPIIDCAPGNKLKTREEIHKLIWDKIKNTL
ncbi:MAG: thymidylate kinase [DPANN group archaeon]|nr:thymidylate kinase [DPANN group archaeon]